MTLSAVSTAALCITTVLYTVFGALFAGRGDYRSAVVLYGIALLSLIGALA